MSQGARRKRNWRRNKREQGWTNSMIDGPRRGGGSGGGSSGSSTGSSSSRSHAPRVRQQNVSKQIVDSAKTLSHIISKDRDMDIFFFDKTDPGLTYEETEVELSLADILVFDQDLLEPAWDKQYSNEDYRCEVRSGELYTVPTGWNKIGLTVSDEKKYKGWNLAYHGTTHENSLSILRYGLVRPGNVNPDGSVVVKRLGQRGAKANEPLIYVTPSIHYASLYAHPHEIDGEFYQIVFQVRVKPGSFKCQSGLMRKEVWDSSIPIDMRHDYSSIEWLLTDEKCLINYGILVKKTPQHPYVLSELRKSANLEKVAHFEQHIKNTTNNAKWSYNTGTKCTPKWTVFSDELNHQIESSYKTRSQKSSEIVLPGTGVKAVICFPSGSLCAVNDVKYWRHVTRNPPMLKAPTELIPIGQTVNTK